MHGVFLIFFVNDLLVRTVKLKNDNYTGRRKMKYIRAAVATDKIIEFIANETFCVFLIQSRSCNGAMSDVVYIHTHTHTKK